MNGPTSETVLAEKNALIAAPPLPLLTPQVAQPAPTALSSAPNLKGLLAALRRRWLLALVLGSIPAVLAAMAVWHFLPPPKATVAALLKIETNQPKIIFRTREDRADFTSYQRTQAALLKSRMVLNGALRKLKSKRLLSAAEQADPVQWLEQEVKVDFSVGPEFMRVSMTGGRTAELVLLVNTITKTYLDEIVSHETKNRRGRMELLKKIADEYESLLKEKRRDLRNLAKTVGSGESKTLALKHRLALEQLALVQKEMIQVQSGLRKMSAESAVQESKEKAWPSLTVPEAAIDQLMNQDETARRLVDQIAKLEDYSSRIKKVSSPEAADAILKRNGTLADIQANQEALAARKKEIRPLVIKRLRETALKELHARIDELKEQKTQSEKLQELLQDEAKRLDKETRNIGETSLDLETIREGVERASQVTKTVTGEIEALRVELAAPGRVSSFEEALVHPGKSKKLLMAGGAALAALACVLFAVSWWEFRARRINTADEVVQGLGIRLMGTLPDTAPRGRRAVAGRDPYSQRLLIESVDAARTMLMHAARTEAVRVVMVTSAVGGEGKTSVASHLAISLARAGWKTLLVDADLRRPAAHRLFNLPLAPGFSEILRSEVHPAEAIRATALNGLWMIPGGHWSSEIVQALAQGGAGMLFGQLKDSYHFIVVDSAPVLPVADSLLIGQHVDAVIFSILRNVSRLPSIYAAHQRLTMLGVRMLGAVVNGAQEEVYGSSSYYQAHPVSAT
jgi:capsular exopolysaccharide synthesis family protein